MNCLYCGTLVALHARSCHACGEDVGFPNVRAAQEPVETNALAIRLNNAVVSARARRCSLVLDDFGVAVSHSAAVLSRNLGWLDSFVKTDNLLYASFHQQVRAGMRIPEDNRWDKGRSAAEGTIHPNYHEQISYAALSIDGVGVLAYGEYSITLKEKMVERRTSVFDENPFLFCERHRVIAGHAAPPGYRACWGDRHKLAMAKLHSAINASTTLDTYASVLIRQGTSTGDADCIEAHLYGPIHRAAIERVKGPRPKAKADLIIWKSLVRILRDLGAVVEEV